MQYNASPTRAACHATALAAAVLAAPSAGQVTAIGPSGFAPGAIVETFEDVVGVIVPPDPFFLGFGDITSAPTLLPSGAAVTGFDSYMTVYDAEFDPDGVGGWAMSIDANDNIHFIDSTTTLPSGQAFAAHANFDDPSIGLTFSFAAGVTAVGAFVEGEQFFDGNSEVVLEAFDMDGVSLGTVSSGPTDGTFYDNALDGWVGLSSDVAIGSVSFYGVGIALDDLTFTLVPAPGAAGLLCLGGVVATRRRRRA